MSKITNKSNITSKYTMPDSTSHTYSAESNVSTSEYMTDAFLKVRSSAKTSGVPTQTISQTLVLTNNSEYEISNIKITDTIGTGATFVDGTLKIDNQTMPTYDPTLSFELGKSLSQNGGTSTITYDIAIDADASVTQLSTISSIRYDVNEMTFSERSNSVLISIVNEKITIVKSASALAVVSGQTITFTNVITNEGNMTNTNIMFYDPIPEGTTFIQNSVKIDGISKDSFDPQIGFAIDDLGAGQSTTVTFDVSVN